MTAPVWLSTQAVAAQLGVHGETVKRWLRSGELAGVLFSRRSGWRVRQADLDAFMARRLAAQQAERRREEWGTEETHDRR